VKTPAWADRAVSVALGALGLALFLGAWQVIGQARLAGATWPPLTDVLAFLGDESRRPLFERAMGATLRAIALGYGGGWAAGLALAMAGHVIAPMRPGIDRLAAVVHSIPSIALGPLLIVFLSREGTPAAIAGINVFFVIYVAATSGLGSASAAHRDIFLALGSSRGRRLLHLELPASVPAIASGMRLAVPATVIGVIIGEWFGAPRGLGLLIVNAMQNFQIPLLWSAVLLAALTSLVLYTAMTLLERAAYARYR